MKITMYAERREVWEAGEALASVRSVFLEPPLILFP